MPSDTPQYPPGEYFVRYDRHLLLGTVTKEGKFVFDEHFWFESMGEFLANKYYKTELVGGPFTLEYIWKCVDLITQQAES